MLEANRFKENQNCTSATEDNTSPLHLAVINAKNFDTNENERIRMCYTIKEGDNKRLNKKGILVVYNLNQAIEIPVIRLLGKFKKTHVGVTLYRQHGLWQIEAQEEFRVTSLDKKTFTSKLETLIYTASV